MAKNERKKQKRFRYAALILAVVFLFSTVLFFIQVFEKRNNEYTGSQSFETEEFVEYNGDKYKPNKDVESFLLLGLDKFSGNIIDESYNNDRQSDFLMLFIFNNKLKEYSAIHINRDTMVTVNILGIAGDKISTETMQLALAHTYGNGREVSCRNTADSVSQLLYGVDIKNYASVTMDAVPIYNDLLGGVEVTVLDDFYDIDNSLIKGEKVTLKGQQALTYVRTRYGLEDSTNATRMERQRQYLEALRQKTVKRISEDDEFAAKAVLQMSEYMVSNRTVNQLQALLNKFSDYKFNGVTDLKGKSITGDEFMEFYPDEDFLKETVINSFYEKTKK